MSDEESGCPRVQIEPEPSGAELVAILMSLRTPALEKSLESQPSHWAGVARREQLRYPIDDRSTGWNR